MTIAVKRILLVTRDVQFAINVKRALESLGEYAVTPGHRSTQRYRAIASQTTSPGAAGY